MSNAVKYTDGAGTIKIVASYEKDIIKVEVADEGLGLDQSQIDKLFNSQDESSLSNDYAFCLGLKVCKAILAQMNGSLCGESDGHGTGTTVTFTMPFRRSMV